MPRSDRERTWPATSVVKADAHVGPGVWIRTGGAVVGRAAVIGAGAKLWRGGPVTVADRVTIGEGAWIGGGATVGRDVGHGAEKVPAMGAIATGAEWAKFVDDRGSASWIHETAEISADAEIGPGVWIGRRTRIKAGARIGAFTYVASPYRRSLPGTTIRTGAVVGPGVWIRGERYRDRSTSNHWCRGHRATWRPPHNRSRCEHRSGRVDRRRCEGRRGSNSPGGGEDWLLKVLRLP